MLGPERPDGAILVQGRHRPQRRYPRTWPRAQRQPKPLQRAIPTLTGAVLVVNARMGEQQRLARSPAGCSAASNQDEPPDKGRRCRSGFGALW
jgi:hypothetical protein